jgi:UDP-N-acetylmuramoyl-L-alanyl-D-glutamate--2,6-diaminopimelate ligase
MKLKDVLRDIPALELNASPETEITDVCYDSRKAAPGALFVAVRGYETDGHKYIPSALERGAAVIACEEKPAQECPYVLLQNTRKALGLLSANLLDRPAEKLRIVGVTGTNGKTTTTNLVRGILETVTGGPVGLIGTNRNITGKAEYDAVNTTPESRDLQGLFREMVDAGCKYAVMEVSSHALSLDRVEGVPFPVGCFTNLSQDHLDFYGTMEAYLEAKLLLFDRCGTAAVNLDDPAAPRVLERAGERALTFGLGEKAQLRGEEVRLLPDRVEFTAVYGDQRAPALLHIPGRFSVYNALAALACCLGLGLELEEAAAALKTCEPVKGRMEVVPTGKDYTVLIDYAVTPDALDNMIRTVKDTAAGRVGVLFGCGGDRDRTKRPKMGRVVAELADYVIITSDNPRTEDPEAIIADILPGLEGLDTPRVVIPDRREAIRWGLEHAQPGDTLVLTGKGHETYQIVGKTKHHMDEREIIAEVLGL